jgi:hypothetical protein
LLLLGSIVESESQASWEAAAEAAASGSASEDHRREVLPFTREALGLGDALEEEEKS